MKSVTYGCTVGLVLLAITLSGCVPQPEKVEVPNLIGSRSEVAIESLESLSLNPDALKGEAASELDLESIVYFQAPDPGTKVKKNSIVTFTSYDKYLPPPRPQRNISILWMGNEDWTAKISRLSLSAQKFAFRRAAVEWSGTGYGGYGGTHIVSFHEPANPDWYVGTNVKHISYLKYYSFDEIRAYVRKYKDHPNNGGYWLIEGHEPDITGTQGMTIEENIALRRKQYEIIREEDPDAWNHPVFIWYDMTGELAGYPGWGGAFPKKKIDGDIFVVDCYPNVWEDGSINYDGLIAGGRLVDIGLARSPEQFIPNLGAAYPPYGKPSSLVEQFDWWDAYYRERHNGKPLKAIIYWFWGEGSEHNGIKDSEYLQEEVRKIHKKIGLLE